MNYLEKRVSDVEAELTEKAKQLDLKENELKQLEVLKKEKIEKFEAQIQEKSAAESNLLKKITEKDGEIEKLQKIVESLSTSDSGAKEQLQQLHTELASKTESLAAKELELGNLIKSLESTKLEFDNLRTSSEKQIEEIREKNDSNQELNKKNEVLVSEITVLRLEVERFQNSLKDTDASMLQSQEIERNLKQQISELAESQVKLESEIAGKQSQLMELEGKFNNTVKEVEERDKCIAGLEAEVKSINQRIAERESTISQSTKNFEELKAINQKVAQELDSLKKELESTKKSNEETCEKLKSESDQEKSNLTAKIEDLIKNGKEKDSSIEKSEKNVALLTELKTSLEEKMTARENELKEIITRMNKAERDDAEKVKKKSLKFHLKYFKLINKHFFSSFPPGITSRETLKIPRRSYQKVPRS